MQLSDFDYELPDELIARYPAAERRGSRLLRVDPRTEGLADHAFAELPGLLAPGDLLVFNDTRVVRARLQGQKTTGGRVEALIERIEADNAALVHLRASKTPKPGALIAFDGGASAVVGEREGELFRLLFDRPLAAWLAAHGEVPLPPYLERAAEPADAERYQTVYAREPGAVAAPTAGLHFDEALLDELAARGIERAFLTLHVGAGTFQNLRAEKVEDNRLHSERVVVGDDVVAAVAAARAGGGRVGGDGDDTARARGWASRGGALAASDGETDLFIRPGYAFRTVDAMLTNFHLPRSSLLMLVAAFAGRERMLAAYRHAVLKRYRFFSYGDAMLIQSKAGA